MPSKNTSDQIEEYIKHLLAQSGMTEIKRSHLAESFQVVPSQINYVIKTRFTESRGYLVESKRGGGGYIRIAKVKFSDNHQLLGSLMATLGDRISQHVFDDLIQLLFEEKVITQREGNMLLAMSSDEVLGDEAPQIRTRMLRKILHRLDRKKDS
ncbi:CtsR family transcriptional regulator [Streptococcus pluranimalium]|uniref:Transcriptional regulator CtsR n=2 Tax=Streptococcus TaxID=1301 RepID=V6Z2H0_STRAG|nr:MULTISPECIES: CtsR family transcriptional regulator [Streptococcus]ESV55087.1 CtsR family transcriptional regulator [Streptococcus agalactiae LMG 14747]MDY3024601.1 CtsR family transcriptional regulator [Streptococcus hyovaginalis]MDY4510705.1 CtsR family transcriptional regulator [Streptococcus hyovaginalis]MDY5974931.1 CtsR family transcriptional regulator [Streptococcus hyovaginalis]SNV46370.1 transcriptional regulator [Streptococcus acidominimus]